MNKETRMQEYTIKHTGDFANALTHIHSINYLANALADDICLFFLAGPEREEGCSIVATRKEAEWLNKHLNRNVPWIGQKRKNRSGLAGSVVTPKKQKSSRENGKKGGLKSKTGAREIYKFGERYRVFLNRVYLATVDTKEEGIAVRLAAMTGYVPPKPPEMGKAEGGEQETRPKVTKDARGRLRTRKVVPIGTNLGKRKQLTPEESNVIRLVGSDNNRKTPMTLTDYANNLGNEVRKIIIRLTNRGLLGRYRNKYVTITDQGKKALRVVADESE